MTAPQTRDTPGGSAAAAVDTLYYDGRCALCLAEVEQLRGARDDLALIDVHDTAETPDLPPREGLLRRLHLRRADGSWLSGADANVAAWEGTPRWRWLRMLRWPLLRRIVDVVYAGWARWRYRRLYG